ncbi:shikimate kinase [Bacteroidia bacterium]|nr:shikimate kinase [Bacteroidia bacterium]GHT61124.1 shikimate kinase [Bacteroidia bacterium]
MIGKQKIFLIGYMGSGKTTMGKQLAKKLNLQFVDMDLFIENRYHKSISAIFEEKGEATFREIERKTLHEIIDFENVIISTGGGLPCFFDNMDMMNQSGITIYLKVSVEELAKRLRTGKQKRPLVKDKKPEELKDFIAMNLEKREAFYNKATFIFESDALFSSENFRVKIEQLIENIQT